MSLNNLGTDLSRLGRREEALARGQEAVDIRRRLAQSRPDAFLPDLAMSLNNLGARLSNFGRREEALAASQEAVDIRRRLAHSRPDAFLPALANSLGTHGNALMQAEQDAEAVSAFLEGLAVIAPFVEKHAQAFGGLASALSRDYAAACEKAGAAPDAALLERVAWALGGEADTDEAATEEALKARVDAILDAAGKTGALDEDALADLPSGLAERLRAAWTAARSGSGTENAGG
jgi:tetratricopeptide (TPR) repeat protein